MNEWMKWNHKEINGQSNYNELVRDQLLSYTKEYSIMSENKRFQFLD